MEPDRPDDPLGETFITAEDLFAAAKGPQPIEKLYLGFLRKWAWCQGLSGVERGRWENSFVKGRGDKRRVDPERAANARALLAVKCLVNNPEDRRRLFTDEDAIRLGKLPSVVLNPIYEKCQQLSGVGDDDIEELERLSVAADPSGSASS